MIDSVGFENKYVRFCRVASFECNVIEQYVPWDDPIEVS